MCLLVYLLRESARCFYNYIYSESWHFYTELKLYKKLYCKEIVLCIWLDHLDDYKVCMS